MKALFLSLGTHLTKILKENREIISYGRIYFMKGRRHIISKNGNPALRCTVSKVFDGFRIRKERWDG